MPEIQMYISATPVITAKTTPGDHRSEAAGEFAFNSEVNNSVETTNNMANEVKEMNRKNASSKDKTTIQKFYVGKSVFITGATGFLGKTLMEKLLRTCPDLDTVYILVRQKKGKDPYSRLDEIFDDHVFSTLKQQFPKFRHKVAIMLGDCAAAGLGLALHDRQVLIEKVNVIFHVAATVKFDENLRTAVATNVIAPLQVISMAKEMKHLQAVVHVSTAYSHCHLTRVEEQLYPCGSRLASLQPVLDNMTDQQLERLLPTILGKWPNTYTFTKALAEDEIKKKCGGLPLAIFRPAIVTSSYKEPVPSWIDNMYGPTGVVAGGATGIMRTMHADPDVTAEVVPVDLVVNCLIAVSQRTATRAREKTAEPTVYNYVSSVENRISWGDFLSLICRHSFDYPLSSAVWYRTIMMNKSATVNALCQFLLHILPAFFLDGLSLCLGQKPKLMKVYRKIHKFSGVLSYFCNHHIVFSNDNVRALWSDTSPEDQQLYPFSMADLDWVEYFTLYLRGIRTYIFKESDDSLKSARTKWNRLYYLHQLVKVLFVVGALYVFHFIFASVTKFGGKM